MSTHSPTSFLNRNWIAQAITLLSAYSALICGSACGQVDRQQHLENLPLAEVDVQSLAPSQESAYEGENQVMMYRPEQEDPLSFYARTQDGEWLIPSRVDSEDPWVRLLVLGPAGPMLADVAIEINQRPFRAAREGWIDKLIAEAKATFLVRTGAATAESVQIEKSQPADEPPADKAVVENEVSDATDDEDQEETQAAQAGDDDEAVEEVATVAIQGRQTRTLFQRLINYLAAEEAIADREEVRWLLAEWTGGPALLTLSPAFAWRRADLAPLWQALDQDHDQKLTREEMAQASTLLKKADINRDDTVDLRELERLAKNSSSYQRTNSHPLIVVIDEYTDWEALRRDLRHAYPEQGKATTDMPLFDRIKKGDRSLKLADLTNLLSLSADIVYRVSFGNDVAKLSLLSVNEAASASSAEQVITLEIRAKDQQETNMELSAAQGEVDAENDSGDMQQAQVAVGAVVDGYPLFRLLDVDNNRQLTLRERRNVTEFLSTLDRNQDGQVDRSEIPTPIRLAVTHGPYVHKHLSEATAAQQQIDEGLEAEVPAWFLGMDRNQDGDLSRREFKGNPSQFAKFDQDGDGLICQKEAQENATASE